MTRSSLGVKEESTITNEKNHNLNKSIGSVDYVAVTVISMLLFVGIIMIFSSGLHWTTNVVDDKFYLLKRQTIFAIMGFIIMIFMSFFNYKLLLRFAVPSYVGVNILLVIVALFGAVRKGASRAIMIPIIGFEIQPLELAKVSTILIISYIIYKNKNILKTWAGFILVCSILGVTSFLVLLGSLSSAIIVTLIGSGIIFIASPHITRFVVAGSGAAAVGVIYIAFFSQSFRGARFSAWLDPFAYASGRGYQIINSLYAIASGGPFGVGLLQSRQKSFIPEPFNDFIFAVIIEEIGYVGATFIIFLFAVLIWRGVRIAINTKDLFGSLLATGIVIMIASQVIINVAVVTNSMPNTGIPMPFISYGGSSLMVTMVLMGILLNISREIKQ
jgi:cell division protein FtsW